MGMEMKIDIFGSVSELMGDLKADVDYLNGRTSCLESVIGEKADCAYVNYTESKIDALQEQMTPVNAFQRIADDYKELEGYRHLGSIYSIQDRFKKLEKEKNEFSTKCKELAENVGALTVENEHLKHTAVTMDIVERAAYDVIRGYMKELDNNRNSGPYTMTQDHAAVTVLTTRMTERIQQYLRKGER